MERRLLKKMAGIAMMAGLAGDGPAEAAEAPPGASSCTGCHAPSKVADSAIPRIAGRKAAETVAAMREFKGGTRPSTVMGRIAKGFDDQQIDAIAAWFAAQPE